MSRSRSRRIHRCNCEACRGHPYGSVAQQHRAINRVLAIQEGDRSIALLACITGLSRNTIYRGKREVEHPSPKRQGRIREPGAGRPLTEKNSQVFSMPSTNS